MMCVLGVCTCVKHATEYAEVSSGMWVSGVTVGQEPKQLDFDVEKVSLL